MEGPKWASELILRAQLEPCDLSRTDRNHYEMIMNANAGTSKPISSFVKEALVIITHKYRFKYTFEAASRKLVMESFLFGISANK